MIHVLATITTQPGMREKVLEIFRANMPAVHAEEGCISYEAVVDVPDFGAPQTPLGRDTFIVVERWTSAQALRAHGSSAHMAQYAEKTRPMLAHREVNVLEAC